MFGASGRNLCMHNREKINYPKIKASPRSLETSRVGLTSYIIEKISNLITVFCNCYFRKTPRASPFMGLIIKRFDTNCVDVQLVHTFSRMSFALLFIYCCWNNNVLLPIKRILIPLNATIDDVSGCKQKKNLFEYNYVDVIYH